jgi:hypothetical protein
LENGDLIEAVVKAGFDVLVTTDKNIRYQQNLSDRRIALVVLERSHWPMVKLVAVAIESTVDSASPGSYTEVPVPAFIKPRSGSSTRQKHGPNGPHHPLPRVA